MSSAGALVAARRASSSPNDKVRVACVGLRGRGKDHINGYTKLQNAELVALCDVDESVLNKSAAKVEELTKKRTHPRRTGPPIRRSEALYIR